VRTDRHNHRPVAGDSDLSSALQVLARLQQNLIWSGSTSSISCAAACASSIRPPWRPLGQSWRIRSPWAAGDGADSSDWPYPFPLQVGSDPASGRPGAQPGGTALDIQGQLRAPQLAATPLVDAAYGKSVAATVRILRELNTQLASVEAELAPAFERHPDAEPGA